MSPGNDVGGQQTRPGNTTPGRGVAAREAKEVVFVESGLGPLVRRRWKSFAGGGIVFFTFFMWWGLQPLHGTIHVGICRTLLQMQLKYPTTMKVTEVEWFKNSLRLYFTDVDAYGQNRSDIFECEFNPDLTLIDARMNRRSLGGDKITSFNKTLPQIIVSKPDTIVPGPLKDDLLSLKKD